jgi:DNA-binding Xre family transcriptional regulator
MCADKSSTSANALALRHFGAYLQPMLTSSMVARFILRDLLEEHGISQSTLARDSGLSPATINRLCVNATAQVSLETLDKVIAALRKAGIQATVADIIAVEPDSRRRGKG